jgi:hypothetical protein
LPTLIVRETIKDYIIEKDRTYTQFFHSVYDVIIYLHNLQEDSWSNVYYYGICDFEVDDECVSKYVVDGTTKEKILV